MSNQVFGRRVPPRYLVYIYHLIVTKLLVSFAFFGLLLIIVSQHEGQTALNSMQTALSLHLVLSACILAGLFAVSTLSPFFPEFLVTVGTGFIFGTVSGSLFSVAAITLAASANFSIARHYGRRIIQLQFDLHSLQEIRWTAARITPLMVFFTWLLPSINFDLISYPGGLSAMRYRTFLLLTVIGNVLSSVLLAFLGEALRSTAATVVVVTLLIYTLVGAGLYLKELPPWLRGPQLQEQDRN
ncbi:MAG: TVP38/TMEM64 family protein [Dehalococcoidia bacterium]